MAIGKRIKITMEFEVTLDQVPGWGDRPEDWIALISREFLSAKHYGTECDLIDITFVEPSK